MSLLLSLTSSSSSLFLSGWMCPQVRVIFPLAQIRAELKSQAKVTALPPEILCQTSAPPPHRAEVREQANSAHKRSCCCASFVTSHFFGGVSPISSGKTLHVSRRSSTSCLFLLSSLVFVQNCDGHKLYLRGGGGVGGGLHCG